MIDFIQILNSLGKQEKHLVFGLTRKVHNAIYNSKCSNISSQSFQDLGCLFYILQSPNVLCLAKALITPLYLPGIF